MNNTQKFYDKFLNRLISDYAFGNERIESAIEFTVNELPRGSIRVLDIGFGLGWSSQEIIHNLPHAQVDGIDLSPKLVEFAEKLCNDPRATFRRQDLTEWVPGKEKQYDAVLMLDVYEHVPKNARKAFHEALRRVLKPEGILILSCPSKKHQDHLREFNPEGLQPVDEDITSDVAECLAHDLKLKLLKFEERQIWTKGDYNHILIGSEARTQTASRKNSSLQNSQIRRSRLLDNCRIKVHAPGIISHAREGRRICVATPQLNVYSETFIRRHIETLPFDVVVLSGHQLSRTSERWLLQKTLGQRISHRLLQKLGRFDERDFAINRIAAWLRQENVGVVLAEYGFTGVAVAAACAKAEVPLIVHFHGYDAHNRDAIAPVMDGYFEMFAQAAAFVAVSTAMVERLTELGAPREKIHYIPYHVDPNDFPMADVTGSPLDFLAVGRFVEKKAPHLTILAFAEVLKRFPDARLEMAGDGPLLGPCKWLAKSLRIEGSVTFHGKKNHHWVAQAMQRVRGFVQHSVTACNGDSEGTPLAVLEAQCSGLPVIATSHTGIADVVIHGETGFLCAEGDIQGMIKYMVKLLNMDLNHLRNMGLASRKRILESFSEEHTLDKISTVIKRVAL